jgi:hypothetical protein
MRRKCIMVGGMGLSRRTILALLAGTPALTVAPALARTPAAPAAQPREPALIGRLIGEARPLPKIAQRIDFISSKLLGVRYQAHTLIGGPKHPERFVVRDDAFDCVTFCEVVLAAAIARDFAEFESSLRRIRYEHGNVQYDQRNHYFADWSQRNIENQICRPVAIAPSLTIKKTVSWHREFGKRQVSILAIPRATFLANKALLAAGDIIGFTSQRSDLDYYHTGLVARAKDGTVLLRHASQSRGRVLEEKMDTFLSFNPVAHVTLLRAVEAAPVAGHPPVLA